MKCKYKIIKVLILYGGLYIRTKVFKSITQKVK